MPISPSANPLPAPTNVTAADAWEHSLPYRVLMQELALRHKDVLDGHDIERLLVDWETAQRKVQKLRDLPEANLEEYAAALQDCATKEQPLKKILHAAETTALCFSGGGIRSASFGLGVLTQLARLSGGAGENGVLNKIDYVSTVSGGGYVGSWFTGWLRAKNLDRIKALGNASGSAEVSQPANPSALDQIIEDLGGPPPTAIPFT
jgi:hypothetical protein